MSLWVVNVIPEEEVDSWPGLCYGLTDPGLIHV